MPGCFICDKHARPDFAALVVAADDLVVVSHLPLELPERRPSEHVYLGYLFVEPRRRVAELGDLSMHEAAALGRHAAAASGALQRSAGAEHVYAAVVGHGVEHLHLHLVPRYPGTPREYWWTRVDEWPGAPRGDARAVAELVERLRAT